MYKWVLLTAGLIVCPATANAADLVEVYQQALVSDPVFQQAIAQHFVTRDNVPISIANILPTISASVNPAVTRYGYAGTEYRIGSIGNLVFYNPRNITQRTYNLNLNISQPVFDFSLVTTIAVQLENAKSATASLKAALQNLMIRVSSAYFAVLRDEEEIAYTAASKRYYQFQLNLINEQYQAGVKTITDVHTAQAAYESSVAAYIMANKRLANDRENLRVITGIYYPRLSYLKNNFPLVAPRPNNMNQWVRTALAQNWSIKVAQYSLEAAKQNIRQQYAGHFPVITLQSSFARQYTFNIDRYSSYIDNYGAGTISDRYIGFNVDIPLFEGGGVVSKTRQARHLYDQQQQVLEESIRTTLNNTRQSFMNIIAGISQIRADEQIINSSVKSLQGTIDRYNEGIETLLDVLNREEKLYQAQVSYASDRYDLVNNILLLKEAAGTLNFEDLRAVNSWLSNAKQDHIKPFQDKLLQQAQSDIRRNKSHLAITRKQSLPHADNIQGNMDARWTDMIAQIRKENRDTYKKLESENEKRNAEIARLKFSMSELKKELQSKNHQLDNALQQLLQLKKEK